jgi:capsular polysaccharide biosynthesis protein
VKKVPHVFQYGVRESNGQPVGSTEQLPQPAGTSDLVPPQRSATESEGLSDPRGSGQLMPARQARLAIMALTIILLGTGAGLAGALTLPKTYGARAELLYPISQDQRGGDPLRQDRNLSTQLVYLKSRAVLGPIAQKQGRQYTDLDRDVSVQVLQTSEVIQVEAHGNTKEAARQTLQAVVEGYLELVGQPSGVTRNLDTQLADARANTARLQTQVTQLTTAVLAGTATQISLNEARAQVVASVDREKAIQARIDEIKLTGQGTNTQLLTAPYVLPDPVSPQPLIAAGTGALVGLIVAAGVVAVAARRRTRP